jgi:hypothetical protein
MASKKTSATQKANYKIYLSEERHAKNKIRKLERHVAKVPKDEQAAKALDILIEKGVSYTRNRKAIKPNSTIQKKIKRSKGFSHTKNTFFDEIVPKPSSSIHKKA